MADTDRTRPLAISRVDEENAILFREAPLGGAVVLHQGFYPAFGRMDAHTDEGADRKVELDRVIALEVHATIYAFRLAVNRAAGGQHCHTVGMNSEEVPAERMIFPCSEEGAILGREIAKLDREFLSIRIAEKSDGFLVDGNDLRFELLTRGIGECAGGAQ